MKNKRPGSEDPYMDMNEHDKDCDLWYGSDQCNCSVRWRGIEQDLSEEREAFLDYEPPVRRSKTAKPKHGVSGRSIFTLWDQARKKKGKK